MNVEFTNNCEVFHERLARLHETANALFWISPDLLPEAFKELITTSNILRLAAEELYQQNEELVRIQHSLERECQSYKDLFELAPEAYLITNGIGIIEAANRAACNLLNVSKSFIIDKSINDFVATEQCQHFRYEATPIYQWGKVREILSSKQYKGNLAAFETAGIVKNKRSSKPEKIQWLIREKNHSFPAELAPFSASINYDYDDCDIKKNRPTYKYSKGETIPLNPSILCYLLQGSVKLSTFCETGEEVLLGLAIPEMVFGSTISLDTYQAISLSDVELMAFSEAEIAANQFLSYILLPKIKQRSRQAERLLFISGRRRVEKRLQHLLLFLKEEIGQKVANGTRLLIRLTHEELASACCTTRVTITRLMSKLHQCGFISFDAKNHIIINDSLESFLENQMSRSFKSHSSVIQ
jgi:CRP-like cAMP-binding protein